jgi:hypothetical protein
MVRRQTNSQFEDDMKTVFHFSLLVVMLLAYMLFLRVYNAELIGALRDLAWCSFGFGCGGFTVALIFKW